MKFKCKSCGAPLDVSKGQTVVTCEFCQMKQTVPNADDERKENLYNRANALRTECDFDKAILSYQSILSLFPNEAEAHWGVCLCKYGIEYVDDPVTHKKKPTIHRMSYDSILKDSDYLAALAYADVVAKEEYVAEATEISNIQKNILSISQKEKPFDIFICYKETSEDGKRTPDSVMAQEIYSNLIDKGYKVFFSRITLESKLGSMYEPYIFAALNSAKIMLVIGTKVDYFNATWVKNEWKRFIDLMKTHSDRYLIPCYKDMDAYQMPEDFLSFQAQDLSKLGFMQDLLRGIDKIMGRQQSAQVTTETKIIQTDVNVSALLKRAEILLTDGDFDKADEILEKVLDNDPTNSKAYLFKLLIERRIHTVEELKDSKNTLENEGDFKKAYEFGNEEEKAKLDSINKFISDRIREEELEALYNTALAYKSNNLFSKAKEAFEKIPEYRDSKMQALECIYDKAIKFKELKFYNHAISELKQIKDYKDAEKQIHECEELKKQATYQNACALRDKGQFDEAAKLFGELSDFEDSSFQVQECAKLKEDARKEAIYVSCLFKTDKDIYKSRMNLEKACNTLKTIPGYKDSDQLIVKYAGIMKEWDAKLAKAAEERKRAKEKARKKAKKISLISGGAAVLVTGTLLLTFLLFVPLNRQGKIERLIDEGDYQQAWNLIRENGSFGDTDNLIAMARAGEAFQSLDYETGISLIYDIGGSVDVNYDAAGGNAQTSQTIKKKHIDNDASFSGYDFKGWVLSDYKMNSADHHATIDLLAKYTVVRYSISYDLRGGTCSTSLPTAYDTEESITIPNPTKKGYTFKGWRLFGSYDSVKDYVIPTGSVGNKKLIADWQANNYIVTINANGGMVSQDKIEVTYDSSYQLPVPSRDGYIFDGYTLANGSKITTTGTWKWDDDCVIKANWVAKTDIPYTVNYYFEALDGTYVKQSETMYGTTDMKTTVTAKEVMGFTPTYLSDSVVVKSDGTSQINFYYTRNSYVLSFVTNGGNALEDRVFKFEEPIPKDIVAVREGYTFAGWYTDRQQIDSLSTMPAGNTTAYASYSEETRTALFQYEETSTGVKITGHSANLLNDIVVPTYIGGKPVTEIGDDAFADCTQMTSCKLPESVSSLGKGAFKNCSALTSITGCFDLKEIEADVFNGCEQLSVLPDLTKVTQIGNSAFKDCQYLTTIDIGSGLTFIVNHAFEGCSMLLTTPDISNVTYIGNEAFKGCSLLSEVGTLDGSAELGDGIFSECDNIGKMILSFRKILEEFYVAKLFSKDSLSDSKYYSVVDKDGATYVVPLSLKEIDIDNVTELPGYLFYGMKSLEKIQSLSSASLTKIGKYAFAYCSSLKETPNLSMIVQIQEGTFLGCSGISNIDLADQVTSIGEKAFSGCTSLARVNSDKDGIFNIPDTITFIGDDAFSACSLVEELHLPFVSGADDDYSNETSYALGHIFGTTPYKDSYSASQKTWSYLTGKGESQNYYIPNSLTKLFITKGTIDTNALANMTSLTDLIVGDGVKKINKSAFAGCNSLVNLSVPFISSYMEERYELSASTNYTISNSSSYAWTLNDGVYKSGNTGAGSSSTMSITFHEAGMFTFRYRISSKSGYDILTVKLNSDTIVNGIYGETSFESKTISVNANDVIKVNYSKSRYYNIESDSGYFAIDGFVSNELTMIESPKVLGNYFDIITREDDAKSGSYDASFVDGNGDGIDGYVCQFSSFTGERTSDGKHKLKNYYYGIPSSLRNVSVTNQAEIPDYAFNKCSSLISVLFDGATKVGTGSFRNCSSIVGISSNNITELGVSAFEGCTSLESILDLSQIESIPDAAFKGCSSLTKLNLGTIPNYWKQCL